ncbi:MAG: HAMP domain-containing histidine kinase [Bacteroidaceae bacterium]|nr:HAMP domain-containing histidine kinase [Bacteroidaceae bacterium]
MLTLFLATLFCLLVCVVCYILMVRRQRHEHEHIRTLIEENEGRVLSCIGSGIFVWNVTPEYCKSLRRKEGKLNTIQETFYSEDNLRDLVYPEDWHLVYDILNPQEPVPPTAVQLRVKNKEGVYQWKQMEYEITFDSQQRFSMTGFSYNIQDHKDEEERLKKNRTIIEKVSLKQSFLANMSNQIRTPMTNIVSMSTLLSSPEGKELSVDERDMFRTMLKENVNKLLKTTSNVLQFSHLETNEMPLDIKIYNLRQLLEEVYMVNAHINRKGVQLEYYPIDEKETIQVKTDKPHFMHIVSNLLQLSLKYAVPSRETIIQLGAYYDMGKDLCVVYVKDNNDGIPENRQKDIFINNNIAEAVSTSDIDTESDLALNQLIAKRMGGYISVNSQYGKGTSVYFYQPCELYQHEEEM